MKEEIVPRTRPITIEQYQIFLGQIRLFVDHGQVPGSASGTQIVIRASCRIAAVVSSIIAVDVESFRRLHRDRQLPGFLEDSRHVEPVTPDGLFDARPSTEARAV